MINTSVVPWVEMALREISLGTVKEIEGRDTAESLLQPMHLRPCGGSGLHSVTIKKYLLN